MKRTWRQIEGKMVEVTPSARLPDDLRFDSPFVSPVDGSIIQSKAQLHEHNQRNNVIQDLPGMNQDLAAIRQGNKDRITGSAGKRERIEAVRRAYETL